MQQSKTLFFSIIGLAILVCAGIIATRFLFADSLNLPTEPEEIELQVVVAPAIKAWAEQAARNFNQAHPKTQVKIIEAAELIPLADFQSADPQKTPPAAWLAEASFVVDMAAGGQCKAAQPVASTGMAWGTPNSKLTQFNQDYGSLSWENLHAKGVKPDDALKLVIASPQNSAEGLAALISAVAGHLGANTLSAGDVSAADAWLTETFGNRNTQIPATPAEDFATKGVSAGDVGILSMAAWRNVKLDQKPDAFTLTPTQPNVAFDYPFAIWGNSPPEAQAAAQSFRDFLLDDAQQNALAGFSLDPAGANQGGVQIDGAAAQRLLDWANRQLR